MRKTNVTAILCPSMLLLLIVRTTMFVLQVRLTSKLVVRAADAPLPTLSVSAIGVTYPEKIVSYRPLPKTRTTTTSGTMTTVSRRTLSNVARSVLSRTGNVLDIRLLPVGTNLHPVALDFFR